MTPPATQTILLTPTGTPLAATLSNFALSTGAVAVNVVSTIPQTAAVIGTPAVEFAIFVIPSWVTTWWISGETSTQWVVNFTAPAPANATVTVELVQVQNAVVVQGGWTTALPTPQPPPPPPPPSAKQLYGVHGDWNFFGPPGYQSNAASQCVNLGAQVMRSSLLWDKIEGTQGTFNWAAPDATIAQCIANGIKPLFYLAGSPGWANGGNGRYYVPTGGAFTTWVTNYAAFATAVANRYCAVGNLQLPYIELGNEFNNGGFANATWLPGGSTSTTPSHADVTTWNNALYSAIKAVNPAVTISLGAATNLTFNDNNSHCVPGITWLTDMLSDGANCDALAIHAYAAGASSSDPSIDNFPTANSFKDIGRAQSAFITAGAGSKQVWVTEYADWAGTSETIQGGYINTALGLLQSTYSVHVTGTTNAGVYISCFFAQRNDTSSTPTLHDTDLAGLYTGVPYNGPNTIQTTGTNFKSFMSGNPQ